MKPTSSQLDRWLLPDGIADVLPAEARALESARRQMLDLFVSHGYELVQPPLIEHVESLLVGTAHALGLKTFKVVDPASGRLLGVRADMTPQVARIDAHLLNRAGVTRLCYAGPVVQTQRDGAEFWRESLQIGAEIYGYAGWQADLEVQSLLLDALRLVGVSQVRLDLAHAGLLQALIDQPEPELYAALQSKDRAALAGLAADLPSAVRDAVLALPMLFGPAADTLQRARAVMPKLPRVDSALTTLERVVDGVMALLDGSETCQLSVDLADLRGWRYHTGVTFAAFTPGVPYAIARGGRYDDVGLAFGRARPASGFSLDLSQLLAPDTPPFLRRIGAPWGPHNSVEGRALREAVAKLRAAGNVVVTALPGDEFATLGLNEQLVWDGAHWALQMGEEK